MFRYLDHVLEVHICHRKRPWRLMLKSFFESQILKFRKFSRFQSSKKVGFPCAKLVWKHSEHPSRLHQYIKLPQEICLDTLNVSQKSVFVIEDVLEGSCQNPLLKVKFSNFENFQNFRGFKVRRKFDFLAPNWSENIPNTPQGFTNTLS